MNRVGLEAGADAAVADVADRGAKTRDPSLKCPKSKFRS